MKAIILAAGKGTRLGALTSDKPKGMLDFMGKTIIEHQIDMYRSNGMNEIIIIRGYKKNKINYKNIKYIDNHLYDQTNMIESLMCARKLLNDDCIISYSDILFSKNLLKKLLDTNSPIAVTVDSNWKEYWKQRYGCLSKDLEDLQISDNKITRIGREVSKAESLHYRYVGINKFTAEGINQMLSIYDKKKSLDAKWRSSGKSFKNGYMTDLLQEMIDNNIIISPHITHNEWLEIDTVDDYMVAKNLFLNKKFEF
tara:strand:+ start:2714 stop:3475 length:762 start_codon:yes stop_codon:yes gene_type:complete